MMHTSRLIGWLVALLLIIGGVYFLYNYFSPSVRDTFPAIKGIGQFKRDGNNEAALAQYQQILGDNSQPAEVKANAAVYVSGVAFSVSGNQADLIKEVQEMKKIVTDNTLSAGVRAVAMSILGNEYVVSGRDAAVFAEIYKDPPFSTYLMPNNQELSALNLQKASYEIMPSSYAAIKVADIATNQYFVNKKQSASTTASYVALAEDYLRKADAAAIDESKANPSTYITSDRYILYQLSRAYVIGRLAIEKGTPYTNQYQDAFSKFITAARTGSSTLSKNTLLESQYQYAKILAALKDTKNEKIQLDNLAGDLNSVSGAASSPLVLSLKSARQKAPTGSAWTAAKQMMAVSPNFAAAIDKLTAPSGK